MYPIFTTDTSEENIQYVLNLLRELCKVYDGLYENFFEKDGTLKDYLKTKPINLLGIIEGNFENLPKLEAWQVTNYININLQSVIIGEKTPEMAIKEVQAEKVRQSKK